MGRLTLGVTSLGVTEVPAMVVHVEATQARMFCLLALHHVTAMARAETLLAALNVAATPVTLAMDSVAAILMSATQILTFTPAIGLPHAQIQRVHFHVHAMPDFSVMALNAPDAPSTRPTVFVMLDIRAMVRPSAKTSMSVAVPV